MNRMVDDNGHVWVKFAIQYYHEWDNQTFSIDIWAVDLADAHERLEFIKQNGQIMSQTISHKGTK